MLFITKEIIKRIRKEAETELSIKKDDLMIAATHTHSGPDLTCSTESYLNILQEKIVGSLRAAQNNLMEAKIGAGEGNAVIGHNRRNPEKNYFLKPYPQGKSEPKVNVLRIDDKEGNIISTIINTPCHPVVLGSTNLLISPDYPGYTRKLVENEKGGICLFLNGCCGNINPIHTEGAHTIIDGEKITGEELFKEAKRIGNILGGEALKIIEKIETSSKIDIDSRRRKVALPIKKEIPEIKKIIKDTESKELFSELTQNILDRDEIDTEIQVFALDNISITGLPGEVFVEFELGIKSGSPYKYNFVTELANDYIFYVPTKKAFKQGGYEPTMSILTPSSGEKLSRKIRDTIKNLHAS